MRAGIRDAVVALGVACVISCSPAAAEQLPRPLQIAGIENGFQLTERVFSGSSPESDEAFGALQSLGVRTVISVDGAKPDVEQAAKFGLRYVHLPHGYDGIASNTVLTLIKVAQTLEGPLFVHCHHGKHRGPAAAAMICLGSAGWTTNQAVTWLQQAGTSRDYPGLFRVAAEFRMPTPAELAAVSTNFPARASVSGMVDGMVEIDLRWKHLKALEKARWAIPPDQPDLVPATEALLLQEAYRELRRDAESLAKGSEFMALLARAENEAADLHALLKGHPVPLPGTGLHRASELAKAAAQSCSECHKKYRN